MTKQRTLLNLLNRAVEICRSFGFDITVEEVIKRYSEPHRYWHVMDHLYDMLMGVDEYHKENKFNDREYNICIISSVFHDIVYDPRRKDNEEKSVEYMLSTKNENIVNHKISISKWRIEEDTKRIIEVIMGTKDHSSQESLLKKFNKLDTAILESEFIDMMDWENKIWKEYKWAGWKTYKKERIKFLLGSIKRHTYNALNIKNLIDYIENKKLKIGVCYYEIDKLPSMDKYEDNNSRMSSLFDSINILIIFNESSYDKVLIREYAMKSINADMCVIEEDSVIDFIKKLKGDVTIIKEISYINDYNKNIEKQLNKNIEEFRIIYI